MDPAPDRPHLREPQGIAPAIRLAGSVLGSHLHICAFFNSREDEYRVLLPFINDGFESGDRAVHIVDPHRRAEHLHRLTAAGIDTEAARQTGQLELREWADAHLQHGSFDETRMLRQAREISETGRRQGYPRTRFITHMEWALEENIGVDVLLEYEAKANYRSRQDPVVCVYDLARFGGDVVVDVMRTHPMVIIGGVLQENPFFVPPDEFLNEMRERRRAASGSSPATGS